MSQDPREYPNSVKECWAVHQVLRSLGFQPEEIYVATGRDAWHPLSPAAFFAVLRTQGREFSVTLGHCESEEKACGELDMWTEFITAFNEHTFDDSVMEEIYQASHVMQNKVDFVIALANKGIWCPRAMN